MVFLFDKYRHNMTMLFCLYVLHALFQGHGYGFSYDSETGGWLEVEEFNHMFEGLLVLYLLLETLEAEFLQLVVFYGQNGTFREEAKPETGVIVFQNQEVGIGKEIGEVLVFLCLEDILHFPVNKHGHISRRMDANPDLVRVCLAIKQFLVVFELNYHLSGPLIVVG